MKYLKIFEKFNEWDPFDEESDFDDSFIKSEKVDVYNYTEKFLLDLGFRRWDENILLIPKRYFSKLKDGTKIKCIDGKEVIVGRQYISEDSRSGLLAYCLIIDKLKK